MGHLVGKDQLYRALGHKIDGLAIRVPWSDTFRQVLEELYSPAEAQVVVSMPFGLSSLSRLARVCGMEREQLRPLLDRLCDKGLVLDLELKGRTIYTPSPLVIGIFEFTMMRTDGGVDFPKVARLFQRYFHETGAFFEENFGAGQQVSLLRALPHQGSMPDEQWVEVLDYERASAIIEQHDIFSVGICSCRHEKLHAGDKRCDHPLETCSTMGPGADYMLRHGLARASSRSEMLELVARSREQQRVLLADNVKRSIGFICHCCGCCCNVLTGLKRSGYANVVTTSNYIAEPADAPCKGCDHCAKACPVDAIRMVPEQDPERRRKRKRRPEVDREFCIGCGVCALACRTGAMQLTARDQRVLHPEHTLERVLLMALERGTLQNLILDNPESGTQAYMRALLGAFLRLPPVKRALMSDQLRSRFLSLMNRVAV